MPEVEVNRLSGYKLFAEVLQCLHLELRFLVSQMVLKYLGTSDHMLSVDHQSLMGFHAHSCTQPMIAQTPAFCLFLSNLSLEYEVAIGQPNNR
jgi:hypothetical protein